ncbi:DUF2489 domain-containing protein [Alkalimarinus coralli]|uniref:DUF2489 domain-containing protein n=1 Tax=Alkalimarinus coralli TaxID=2935863 RepID=UPI00202B7A62|nr:DUF2489 domain-containing protein [Alkalimarinus coralli]
MNNGIIWGGIVIGALIATALVLFIIKKWKFIKQVEAAKKAQEEEQLEKQKKAVESIKIIALCMIEEQVELSEGCIRIKVLLDHVAPELHDQAPFNVFSMMYNATEHMPTHEARKQADKALIRKLDAERFELEKSFKQEIIDASKAIRDYPFGTNKTQH